jgi:hypothetical protein
MPLQNRVSPFGKLTAVPARGLFMGNRGGRFHSDAKTLTARRWVSRQWICCVLEFRGRPSAVLRVPPRRCAALRGGLAESASAARAAYGARHGRRAA